MATALSGKAGAVKIDTDGGGSCQAVGKIKSWNIDFGYDTLDVTSFESAGDWREFLDGLKQWSGSFDGHWAYETDANGQQVIITAMLTPALLEIELYMDATHYFSGDVWANATSITTNVDGTVDASFTYQGNSTLSYN